MLKTVDTLLTGKLLKIMDEMGHGDQLGLVDRNFPAYRYGAEVIDLRGVDTEAAARAILSVFPLDSYVDAPVERMEIDGQPDEINASTAALQRIADDAEQAAVTFEGVERFDFYERAKAAHAFVQTGETIGYSCFLLKKGVV